MQIPENNHLILTQLGILFFSKAIALLCLSALLATLTTENDDSVVN